MRFKLPKRPSRAWYRNIDWMLPLLIVALGIYSLIGIASATATPTIPPDGVNFWEWLKMMNVYYVRLQLLWFVLGFVLLILTMTIDYKVYKRFADWIYWANVALLAALFIFSTASRGAVSWFKLGSRMFQPSEIAKIAIIIFLAKKIAACDGGIQSFKQLLPILGYFLLPFVLILAQPDFGTALVFLSIFAGMMFLGGLRGRLIAIIAGSGIAAVPVLWMFILNDVQKQRVLVYLGLASDTGSSAYHVTQSKIAIGSGQMFGKGMFNTGALSQLNYVPEKHTDFIFSVVCETFGFVGAMVLLGLYFLLIFRLLYMAYKLQDRFCSLIVVGVVSMLFFHIFENIGMTLGVMPITGIPLPLMSYGGSSVFSIMILLGLVMNVWLRRNRPPEIGGENHEHRIDSARQEEA